MSCMGTEAKPETNPGSPGVTCAQSDSLLLFADRAVAGKEMAKHRGAWWRNGALWETIPQISVCLKVWKQAHLGITGGGIVGPVSAPVYAPTTSSHRQSLLLPALSLMLSPSPAACSA